MRVAVIGRGLIGSAAARHLARAGQDVVLIGPDEPQGKASHRGVFASHYDEGRITRGLDPAPFWSRVSRASIARYAEIEAASGIRFYTERGVVMAGPEGSAPMDRIGEVAVRDGVPHARLDDAGLAARFGYFRFDRGTCAFHQTLEAGFISPRRLVAAQGVAAERAGAHLLRATVEAVEEDGQGVRIRSEIGETRVDRVLIAAGGYTNTLLSAPLPLTVMARTVGFFEVDEGEAARFHAMPPLIYLHPHGDGPYLLPPIRYPDGRFYLKMGGDPVDRVLGSGDEISDWFRSGGDPAVAAGLEEQLRDRMPDLTIRGVSHMACVTTFTPEDEARIERVSDRVGVATAGCGRGAKCSDELGRLGACLITDGVIGDTPAMV
ncbi:monomeric sarcosine oxidase [Roseovarius sp. A-2]|uniref:NAD(P)/FAD-dependent oxidoreductase n=1 Tax=Roseovarius sp. A-2 TaxID=1570360 RepID=UPI0009B544B5|nr:FAD-dependent oxidoreductase [Roseovarius sp. A-2]GAW36267.1 monomeric sarcosine oxidase [Roseovarius sp. A-2]